MGQLDSLLHAFRTSRSSERWPLSFPPRAFVLRPPDQSVSESQLSLTADRPVPRTSIRSLGKPRSPAALYETDETLPLACRTVMKTRSSVVCWAPALSTDSAYTRVGRLPVSATQVSIASQASPMIRP